MIMPNEIEIVTASEGTPEDIDVETIAARVRQEQAGIQVSASVEVHGDAVAQEGLYTN
jgi:hypothetical protein